MMPPEGAVRYPPELPVSQQREAIVAALRAHQVVIVAGETGSGKTTQLPKLCWEAGLGRTGQIGCTQPRRVAAMSISRRVAEELGVTWGREVGCKMRFQDDTNRRQTRIKFMTDGILLAEIQSDPLLRAYSTLILDEAHERSLNIDFLLGYLRGLLRERRDLKLIITSATIDTAAFSAAFDDAPVIEVSGRLFPVEIRYRPVESLAGPGEERDALSYVEAAARATEEALLESDSGDLLLFMPTERDIREARELLETRLGNLVDLLALYGRMASAQQQEVFAPGNKRRVVIATNVAETSLTIPRISVVIDTGLARISRYNARTRTRRLPIEPISQSSANQRAGRAGRVRDGLCIRLYDEEEFAKRPRFTQPEILRSNLAEVILRMKAFHLGEVESFPFLNPPQAQAIRGGYTLLEELGALIPEVNEYRLTALGHELASLPLDPTLGRMLLQARDEGVLEEMVVLAAGLSIPDPRERPEEARDAAAAAHKLYADPRSDFLSLLHLWRAAPPLEGGKVQVTRNALRRFCKANYLSLTRMREWRDLCRQLAQAMEDSRLLRYRPARRATERKEKERLTPEEEHYRSLHRSILSGLLGQVAQRQERNLYLASGNRKATLFPGSTLYERQKKPKKEAPSLPKEKKQGGGQPEWIVAGEIVETSQLFARTVAAVEPEWIAQLGAHLCKTRHLAPGWSAKAGRVLVWERVLLHGLEVTRRQVDYGRVNPQEATELFIRGALIAGEARITHRFFEENRQLRERIETSLTRQRSHRLHDLDEAFYRFYADRIEPPLSSVHDLDRLIRARIGKEPDFLCATEADLVDESTLAFNREAFPDQVTLENAVIPLDYHYAPGEERDGVTLRVPLPLAERLTPGEMQWMIPGLREEQAEALLRSLPKATRKALLPLEPKIAEIARDLQPGREPFGVALTTFVQRRYGVRVEPGEWQMLPDHLLPRVEIIDRRNRAIASGRDLESVQSALQEKGHRSGAWERAVRQWERRGIEAFPNLPETLEIEKIAGVPLLAWPGLREAEGGKVDQILFRTVEERDRSTPAAIVQLGRRAMGSELEQIAKAWRLETPPRSGNAPAKAKPGVASLSALFDGITLPAVSAKPAPRPIHRPITAKVAVTPPTPSGALVTPESIATHLARHLFVMEAPFTAARFEAMLTKGRQALAPTMEKVAKATSELLDLRSRLLAGERRYPGMEADLARLLPPGFLATTPHERLPHLVRYLKAVERRAERAWTSPAKDTQKAEQLAPFAGWEKKVAPEERETFRWLLEEFRVSLFAQELGTAQPVSARRLLQFFHP